MNDRQRCVFLLISAVLAGVLCLSSVCSQLTNNVIISNTGQITAYVTAKSGSARDIQAAVDIIVATLREGNVYIPSGIFNFVDVGESWVTVDIPAGVNIMAQTPPDMDPAWNNRFPLTCHTVLMLPYDVQSGPVTVATKVWFTITGNGDPARQSRFSGIELQGYRSIQNNSVQILGAIAITQVMDFRVDHCIFENTALGISADGGTTAKCRGVFDHNKFINTVGYTDAGGYDLLTVGYGIQPIMFNTEYWDSDITHILGKYLDYSIYMEDNYFSRWRHCISAGSGVHAVFRYNVVENDYADGSIDVHGQALSYEGGRCLEVYHNTIINAVSDGAWDWNGVWHSDKGFPPTNNRAINFRGGGGVIFNNTVDSTYAVLSTLENEQPGINGGITHDLWIWSNYGTTSLAVSGPVQDVDYFLHAPTTFVYTPYPYPHPLVQNNP